MAAIASSISVERIPNSLVCTKPATRRSRLVVSATLINGQEQSSQSPLAKLEKAVSKQMPVISALAMNAMLVLPALAGEEDKGELFDFNLTLPIVAIEFLLTMFALNKIWFEPVSKVMDSRDVEIRKKLTGVRDNSDEIRSLQLEAEAVLKAARAETAGQAAKLKRELAAELDAKLQASRSRIEKELEAALGNLEQQRQETLKSLDSQVQALSEDIVSKLIPFKA